MGAFGNIGQMEMIKTAGFNTAELDLGEIMGMDLKTFLNFERRAERSGLRFDVFSGLLPLDIRIHEPGFLWDKWLEYVDKAAERAACLGAKRIPFGAGKCRSIPAGCEDREEAEKRLAAFVGEICCIFQKYSLEMVVEPLGPANSNYLNRIGETADFARSLKRENCHIMCDLRHMYKTGDPYHAIISFKKEIRHAHIDHPEGELRRFPLPDDGFDYQPYLEALHDSGYDGILTVEATYYEDFEEEAARSCEYLKKCAKAAGYQV